MKKLLVYITMIVLTGCCYSCMSNNDQCIQKLFEATGVERAQIQKAAHLVIIPGNGCSRCIDKAKSEIHASQDTLYVITCHSEKEFYLLTGKRRAEFPNVYLDTGEVAASMKMVGTTPMVYVLEKGKFVSRAPYEQEEVDRQPAVARTTVAVDKERVDWGRFSHKEGKEASFILENTGSDSLHIYYITTSCDCLETRCSKYHAAPGDTLQLKVSFQSDSIGVFVRELYIYGNFPSLPLSLTVEGDCI